MRITIRSLNGENGELDVEPDTTILGLRQVVEDALKIPVSEQRLIYAGTQLEELVTPLWRQRRSSGALAAALGLDKLPDGAPLTLEHYGIQKGSVLNVVRKVSLDQTRSAACAESLSRGSLREPGHSPVVGPPVTQLPAAAPCAPCAPCGVGPSPAQLEALNDLELLVLLRPLLRKRPTLRAALLAEAGEPVAAYNPPALGNDGIWQRGERCLVWSNSAQRWCDGEVVQVARELVDGKIPEGSVEVSFELGRKWIAPQDLAKALRR